MSRIDQYCKPLILITAPEIQETVYKSVFSYCKILQGTHEPWSLLCNDLARADIHNRIAEYCDCDHDVVTRAIDKAFPNASSLEDGVFLKNVDKLMDELKNIASLPEEERFPSTLPKGWEEELATEMAEMDVPFPS